MRIDLKFISSLALLMITIFACAVPQQTRQVEVEALSPVESQRRAQQETQIPKVKSYKRRVTIGRFTNETTYGKGLLRDADLDPLGKQASDILASDLVRSGRFLVFERPDLGKLLNEQQLTGQSDLVGADTVIIGSVSEFGRTTQGTKGFLSSTKLQRVNAKVNIRLVDPKTGHVFFSTTGAGEANSESGEVAGFGSKADYDATLNDRAIRASIADVIDSLINKLETQPWRTYILSIQNGNVLISGGPAQGLKIGDELSVVQEGEKVRSRQTGFMVDLPGKEIARLRVVSFFGTSETDQGSTCIITSGSLNGNPIDKLYITDIQGSK